MQASVSNLLPSFSFRYEGRSSYEFLPSWQRRESRIGEGPAAREQTSYKDPQTGLEVTLTLRRFASSPALDWVLEFANTSAVDTPLLDQVCPLDLSLPAAVNERLRLHHANGSSCQIDDFLPRLSELQPNNGLTLAPVGGRSSNGVLPFMNLQGAGAGLLLAIGWSGQWMAHFERGRDALRITAGQQNLALVLHPGERIRTPRILAIPWQGSDPEQANNLLRRLLLDHYLPRKEGQLILPPLAQCLQGYFYLTGQAGEAIETAVLPKVADLGATAYWIDACWYGGRGEWWQEVGSWQVNRAKFPRGLKPISSAAREAGMQFVLWFEPERVRRGSLLHQEHPEYLLSIEQDPDNFLFDLGNPQARSYMTDLVSALIAENGVDIYRQDFNFDPLPYWQTRDAPGRVGLAEIRHVEGHYAFWDELRRRHPGLWIDNCASGGRRIDLETISRSLPLWPSDFSDTIGLRAGMGLHVGDQCITAGLSRWVPLFGGGVWNFTPYSTRSQIIAGYTFGFHIPQDQFLPDDPDRIINPNEILALGKTLLDGEFPSELARAAIAEWKSIRQFFLGDFYLLLPLTVGYHDWCAWQFHRSDMRAGIAAVFRRHRSPFSSIRLGLRNLDPDALYEISLSHDYTQSEAYTVRGADLTRLDLTIDTLPGSILLRYRQVAG